MTLQRDAENFPINNNLQVSHQLSLELVTSETWYLRNNVKIYLNPKLMIKTKWIIYLII